MNTVFVFVHTSMQYRTVSSVLSMVVFKQAYMKNEGSSWRKRIRSFGYALQGWRALVTHEANARIHCVATIAVLASGC